MVRKYNLHRFFDIRHCSHLVTPRTPRNSLFFLTLEVNHNNIGESPFRYPGANILTTRVKQTSSPPVTKQGRLRKAATSSLEFQLPNSSHTKKTRARTRWISNRPTCYCSSCFSLGSTQLPCHQTKETRLVQGTLPQEDPIASDHHISDRVIRAPWFKSWEFDANLHRKSAFPFSNLTM